MPFVDPRTFLFVANLLGILLAFVLMVQAKSFPGDIHGLRDWAVAILLISCASGLSSMRGLWPDVVTIVTSNAALLVGQLLLVFGLMRYSGKTPHWRPTIHVIAAIVLLNIWLTFGARNYQARIFLMALAQIAFSCVAAYLAWKARPSGFGSRFLTVLFGLTVLVTLWRLGTLPTMATEADDLFDHNLVQQIYLGMSSLGVMALSIGFLLLTNERLRVELEYLATRDPMTGAFNRRAFFERADVEWARNRRGGNPLTAITADIDFFKKVNDTHGHQMGDLVIKDFCARADAMLRIPDILARFGGEEFVILLPDTSLNDGWKVAERLRRDIEKRRAPSLIAYTVSFGVAICNEQTSNLQELLAQADEALYRAKKGGRNRVEV